MAYHTLSASATHRTTPVSCRILLVITGCLLAAGILLTLPAQAAGPGQSSHGHASLTQSTLALNQDLAREYARGEQLVRRAQPQEGTPRWRTSAGFKPRNQAALYPTGEDGVMLEMNFQY